MAKLEQTIGTDEVKSEQAQAAAAAEPDQTAKMEAKVPEIPKHEIDEIIRKRVYAAMAVGMAPIPLLDLAGISAIQIEMVHALAKKYGVPFRPSLVKATVGSLLGGFLPVAFAPAVASLSKFIPVIGWTVSGVSMSLIGGAITYALGNVFVSHFESGGVLLDFDVKKWRNTFKSKVEEGKRVVAGMKKEQKASA
jgi:uncharacterized protein (DUF697 family)